MTLWDYLDKHPLIAQFFWIVLLILTTALVDTLHSFRAFLRAETSEN